MNSEETFKIEDNYYKAYEKRYTQVYEKNYLWSTNQNTPDVLKIIKILNLNKTNKLLEIGCGEGRDAIPLLTEGYNVLAIDYSKTVIKKCNELSNNLFLNNFKQLDIFADTLNDLYDFIYSVAVLHMFITKNHRKQFYQFIYNHLKNDGLALIGTMGNGLEEYESNVKNSFDNVSRKVLNNQQDIEVAATSCKIINWNEFEKEIKENDLMIIKKWVSKEVPDFKNVMFVLVKKK